MGVKTLEEGGKKRPGAGINGERENPKKKKTGKLGHEKKFWKHGSPEENRKNESHSLPEIIGGARAKETQGEKEQKGGKGEERRNPWYKPGSLKCRNAEGFKRQRREKTMEWKGE